jgi:hypothetical protein
LAKSIARSGGQEGEPPERAQVTIEGTVEEKLSPIIKDLPKVQRDQILSATVTIVRTEAFSGPLPHPRHLEEYDRILPGGAERIFKMTEAALKRSYVANSKIVDLDKNRWHCV